MQRVNLGQKLRQFSERWSPRIVGELNGRQIKVAKFEGEFIWHHHADEDDLFLVLRGHLAIVDRWLHRERPVPRSSSGLECRIYNSIQLQHPGSESRGARVSQRGSCSSRGSEVAPWAQVEPKIILSQSCGFWFLDRYLCA